MRLLPLLAVLPFAACKFPDPPLVEGDAGSDAQIDAPSGPPVVSTDQGPHDFGPIAIGRASPLLQVTIRNGGGDDTGPLAVALAGASAAEFEIVPTGDANDCAGLRLGGGATCLAQVRYAPTVNVPATARFEISGNPGGTATVMLTADALTAARLTSTQGPHDFGDIVTGQDSPLLQVIVRNDGEETTGPISLARSGQNPTDFTIVPTGMTNDCAGATLDLQETCIAQVRFEPSTAAARSADLSITASPGGVVTVAMSGDGLTAGNLMVEMPAAGAPLDFGSREIATGATSATQLIRIRNGGGAPTGALDVTVTGGGSASYTLPVDGCDGGALGANMTCDIQVRFNPNAVGTQPANVTIRDTVAMTAASVSTTGIGSARVAITKTGAGTITSNPSGINCGTGCSTQTQPFSQTPISLTATPDSGWVFTSWSGGCAGSNPSPSCSLTLDQGLENVGAVFTQVFTLTVSTTGNGTVTSASPGILCGNGNTDCAETYAVGSTVQLTAEPDAGWEVFSWTGTGTACAAGARTCTVTMSQTRSVAVELRRVHTITVAVSGSGQGSVTGGGINCATGSTGTCSAVAFDGTSVTLTEAPGSTAAGSQILFGGWGSDCTSSGTMTTCVLTVNAAKSVTAGFTLQHRLSLTVTGAGAGTITANPGALTCSASTCTRFYDAGTNLMLAAAGASSLDGVGTVTGDCTAMPCTLNNLTAPRSVSVAFVRFQCVPSSQTCSGGLATHCDSTGNFVSYLVPNGATDGSPATITMNGYQCPMGCHATQPICADVNASNGLNAALDTAAVSASGTDVALPRTASVPAGTVVINTDSYNSTNSTTTITDADGTPIVIPAQVVSQGVGYPEILVLKVRSFTIRSGRTVAVNGARALAIVSHFDVFIAGTVDASGTGSGVRKGPGQSLSTFCLGTVAGPGVGGGANAGAGGLGGGGTAGGLPLGNTLVPLQGGCPDAASDYSGGGALEIVSRTRIALAPTALINLSGGGGLQTGPFGGGGGAGGSIMLEAPTILLTSGSTVAGRGGSGGAVSSTGVAEGNDGPTTGIAAAAGVTCNACGTSGSGGTEIMGAGSGTTTAGASTGGGGGVGRCVSRNATGVLMPPAGVMKTTHSHGALQPRSP